ncbi:MAG: hypothetical protein WDN31_23065 [Hyphomicrobium sp.]
MPVTESGVDRDTWYGQANLDFMKERADIGTAKVVAKLADGITLTNTSRIGQSEVDYVATSAEGNVYHHPQRDQVADLYANQTELNAKFNTGFLKHDVVAGLSFPVRRLIGIATSSTKRPRQRRCSTTPPLPGF